MKKKKLVILAKVVPSDSPEAKNTQKEMSLKMLEVWLEQFPDNLVKDEFFKLTLS